MKTKTIILTVAIIMGCLALFSDTGLASGGHRSGQTALGDTLPGSRYQLQDVFIDFQALANGKKLDFVFKDGGGSGDSITSLYVTFTYDESHLRIDSISYLGGSYPTYSGIQNVDLDTSASGWAMVSLESFAPMDFDSIKAFGLWVSALCPPGGDEPIQIADGASPPAGAACEFVRKGAVKYPQYRTDGGFILMEPWVMSSLGAESTYVGGKVEVPFYAMTTFPPNDTINARVQWDSTYLHLDSISAVGAVTADQPHNFAVSAGGGTAIIAVGDNTLSALTNGDKLCNFFFTVDCSASYNTTYDLKIMSLLAYACPGHGTVDNDPSNYAVKVPDYKATINIRDVSVPVSTQNFKVFVEMKNNFPVITGSNADVVLAAFRFKPQNSKTTYDGLAPDTLFIQYDDTVKLFWEDDPLGDGSYKVYENTTRLSDDIPVRLSEFYPIAALQFDAGPSNGTDSNRTPVETNSNETYYHKDWKLVSTCGDTLFATNPATITRDPGKIVVYTPSGGGGCPYLYAWDGSRFVEENTILSQVSNTAFAKPVADYMRLTTSLTPSGDEFVLQIREFENEESSLDNFELQAVDHRDGTMLAVSPEGSLAVFKDELLPSSAIDQDGADHLIEISSADGKFFKSQSAGYLTVAYNVGKGFDWDNAALGLGGPPPKSLKLNPNGDGTEGSYVPEGIVTTEILSGNGEWKPLEESAERVKLYTDVSMFKPQDYVVDGKITVRYRWQSAAYFDILSIYLPCEQEFATSDLRLTSCVHSAAGDLTAAAAAEDNDVITLSPGQNVELRFAGGDLGDVAPGFVREYVFKASGYYVTFKSSQPLPMAFQLNPNYPNPFNPSTTISYTLPKSSQVTLSVYNVLGQHVKDLVDRVEAPGLHEVQWDGTDETGSQVASGIYLYRIITPEYSSTRKMMLIK